VPLDAGDAEWTEEEVACFQPADAVTLQDEWRTHLPHSAPAIAQLLADPDVVGTDAESPPSSASMAPGTGHE
jgi:hypothetical protein